MRPRKTSSMNSVVLSTFRPSELKPISTSIVLAAKISREPLRNQCAARKDNFSGDLSVLITATSRTAFNALNPWLSDQISNSAACPAPAAAGCRVRRAPTVPRFLSGLPAWAHDVPTHHTGPAARADALAPGGRAASGYAPGWLLEREVPVARREKRSRKQICYYRCALHHFAHWRTQKGAGANSASTNFVINVQSYFN